MVYLNQSCGRGKLSIAAREQYRNIHVSNKDGQEFICKWCNEEFEVRKHTDEKPYSKLQFLNDLN